MHELRIAADLSGIVLDTATINKLSKVTRVNIIFGELVQIVPEIFEFAFRETVRDSVAENAALEIEITAVKMQCKKCDNIFQLKNNCFNCNICGSADLAIIQGKELYIKSIEGE